ncbi:hypothetical protein ACQZV8_03890 [Magnetococcales bacterium HHB-1]
MTTFEDISLPYDRERFLMTLRRNALYSIITAIALITGLFLLLGWPGIVLGVILAYLLRFHPLQKQIQRCHAGGDYIKISPQTLTWTSQPTLSLKWEEIKTIRWSQRGFNDSEFFIIEPKDPKKKELSKIPFWQRRWLSLRHTLSIQPYLAKKESHKIIDMILQAQQSSNRPESYPKLLDQRTHFYHKKLILGTLFILITLLFPLRSSIETFIHIKTVQKWPQVKGLVTQSQIQNNKLGAPIATITVQFPTPENNQKKTLSSHNYHTSVETFTKALPKGEQVILYHHPKAPAELLWEIEQKMQWAISATLLALLLFIIGGRIFLKAWQKKDQPKKDQPLIEQFNHKTR